MDILDIDEALKDDSFIFLEDKTHDDVSNILQQWKSNNLQTLTSTNNQVSRLNSTTFTRPKRKLAQNLECQFTYSINNDQQQQQQTLLNSVSTLNMEIGGLVTTMHKSFLQDTSPPSSICSSMDVSATTDYMNNSLITSADFSNINFLQSCNIDKFDFGDYDLKKTTTLDDYTLDDMIRDRKALESLTMSNDGTLTKDSQIAHIDDISLTFSKTTSGSSTMDNSTDSVEAHNRTEILQYHNNNGSNTTSNQEDKLQRTIILSDEMITDTTFNLVDSRIYNEQIHESITGGVELIKNSNGTFLKQPLMDETICLPNKANTTYECQLKLADERCATPESKETAEGMKFLESTPHINSVRNSRHYTVSIKNAEDVNISPIIATNHNTRMRVLNETFEDVESSNDTYKAINSYEVKQSSNNTFNKSSPHNKLDAKSQLIENNREELEFDEMLNALSRVDVNAEQVKMKKSIESIRKRFNHGCNQDKTEIISRSEEFSNDNIGTSLNSNNSNELKDSPNMLVLSSPMTVSSGQTERLLNRRSRIYDNVNFSNLSSKTTNTSSKAIENNDSSQTIQNIQDENHTPNTNNDAYKLTEKRERDRDRFKTIKIERRRVLDAAEITTELNVPCIDDDDDVVETDCNAIIKNQDDILNNIEQQPERFSRLDKAYENTTKEINYLTYKKPKVRENTANMTQIMSKQESNSRLEARSLSRPRYISGLQKFSVVSKATSASDLDAKSNTNQVYQKISVANPNRRSAFIPKQNNISGGNNSDVKVKAELKSPMGIKSKSFHNLSSTILKNTNDNISTNDLNMTETRGSRISVSNTNQNANDVFKVPTLVSGIRPVKTTQKRLGLVRPSSGYYSLSNNTKSEPQYINCTDTLTKMHAGSSQQLNSTQSTSSLNSDVENANKFGVIRKSGISSSVVQRPSGLKPPSNIRKSGLPRPSSISKR